MSLLDEAAFKALVREALRDVIREELPKLQAPAAPAAVFLTTARAAEVAGVKPDTICSWVKAGRLARHGTSRRLLVRQDELQRFLAGGAAGDQEDDALEESAVERILGQKRAG